MIAKFVPILIAISTFYIANGLPFGNTTDSSPYCEDCIVLVDAFQNLTLKVEPEIKSGFMQACYILLVDSVIAQCRNTIETNFDRIYNDILMQIDSSKICQTWFHLC